MKAIAPSILSADFSKLAEDVKNIEEGGAGYVHVDIMDGHFVPNISYGPVVMKSLVGKTDLPFDVHLMIENPDKYIPEFMTDQTEFIVVHQEACVHLHRTIQLIHSLGAKAGVALNPATPVSLLEDILPEVELVLVMSVNPGFGGQKFIPGALKKIRQLAEIREREQLSFEIEVDGGVGLANIEEIADAGADIFVAGSAVFKAEDPAATCREMKALI